jgi:hypothetical protein
MKIYANILNEQGLEMLRQYKAGTLKQAHRVVKANGRDVLLWTGSCHRMPKKSSLAKHTKKAGVKRAVVLCPPTIQHIYIVNLDRQGETMKEVGSKAFRIVEK